MEEKKDRWIFVCVWCGCHSDSPDRFKGCKAPDGDGHLFQRVESK